ncbi:hypothetical protein [Bradyrhizobium denitrificans]|jgi:hypothetical protein|uniref:hypothetical protein n=1 Tax=Bradyrhizobium denitrificans TaxID=2734912 RepID=UPI001555E62E|nr:hypothetical protein [Bradyrhizobium sp. LMG 8443]NPU23966.1 hypothetical protein [Bradyrhizobium sp. LMG 8443]
MHKPSSPIVIVTSERAQRRAAYNAERVMAYRAGAEDRKAAAQAKRDRKAAKRARDAERSAQRESPQVKA